MANYTKFNSFIENVFDKLIDLVGSPPGDTLNLGLTATSPNAADTVVDTTTSPDTVKATSNALEIAAGFGYVEGGTALTGLAGTRASGTLTVAANQVVFTASGGDITAFRYLYLYDVTAGAAATRPVIAWWDYAASLLLHDGDSLTVKFNNASPGTIFTAS